MQTQAGARFLTVMDERGGFEFPVLLMYPSSASTSAVKLGPYTLDVAMNACMDDGHYPLVIISHGTGSTPYAYRGIATHLASHGYVVALPEHYGNNRNNNHLADSDENLLYRPRHIRLTIDSIATDAQLGAKVEVDDCAIIGHSMGAYTALAVAGGRPWSGPDTPLEVESDARVKALVLMTPAIAWYQAKGALRDVDVPILSLTAELDPYTPTEQVNAILAGIPDQNRIIRREIKNAGHFSFLSPFPPEMRNPAFRPANDPEGFNRAAFHKQLNVELLDYLNEVLIHKE